MQRWQPPPAQPAIPENDPYEVPFPPFTDDLEAGQAPKTKPNSSLGFLGRGFRRLRETLRGATSDEREEAPVTLAEALYETDTAQADEENQKRPKGFLSSFGFGKHISVQFLFCWGVGVGVVAGTGREPAAAAAAASSSAASAAKQRSSCSRSRDEADSSDE